MHEESSLISPHKKNKTRDLTLNDDMLHPIIRTRLVMA